MQINYDPATEWDIYCKFQEQSEKQYIEENQAGQERDLEAWMFQLINNWNWFYLRKNPRTSWNERVLLCIYICNYYNNNNLMHFKERGDAVYEILDEFPSVDALDDQFSEELAVAVLRLSNYLENLEA